MSYQNIGNRKKRFAKGVMQGKAARGAGQGWRMGTDPLKRRGLSPLATTLQKPNFLSLLDRER